MEYQEEDEIKSFNGTLSIVNEERVKSGDNLTFKNTELLLLK